MQLHSPGSAPTDSENRSSAPPPRIASFPKSNSENGAIGNVSMCCFRLGGALYGVDIRSVREILGRIAPWPVPLSPRFIGGLVRYRGEVLTTVDLRILLGLPHRHASGFPSLSQVLVVDGASEPYGLLVDAVEEVAAMDMSWFEPSSEHRKMERECLIGGVFKLSNGLLIQLDPLRLDPMRLAANVGFFSLAPAQGAAGEEG